ncbi:MAG: hypothetical protein U1D29_12810 [Burkholderiales bacterium]|nr:hypothetical protein [Burkholderiales bacterium]
MESKAQFVVVDQLAREIARAKGLTKAAFGLEVIGIRNDILSRADAGEIQLYQEAGPYPFLRGGLEASHGSLRLTTSDATSLRSHYLGQSAASTAQVNDLRTSSSIAGANVMKRDAMIAAMKRDWPTIEADLREASRSANRDLKAANVRRGMWDVEAAKDWARQRGKLVTSNAPTVQPSPWQGLASG